MAKPSILCRLTKGKLIDSFHGFVDTWNYLVSFVENLRGDGDDDKKKRIVVDRTVPDHPVIKMSGASEEAELEFRGTDGTTATGNIVEFAAADDTAITTNVTKSNGVVVVKIGLHWKM